MRSEIVFATVEDQSDTSPLCDISPVKMTVLFRPISTRLKAMPPILTLGARPIDDDLPLTEKFIMCDAFGRCDRFRRLAGCR